MMPPDFPAPPQGAQDADFDLGLRGELGQVSISHDVVARVAAVAALQTPGVSLGGKFSIGDLLGRKEPVRGVSVQIEQGQAVINFEIKVEYGRNMYDLANALQRRVKNAVEQMTGLSVQKVNVAIVDVLQEAERRERGERREEQ